MILASRIKLKASERGFESWLRFDDVKVVEAQDEYSPEVRE
ncbi:hypothetical protein [Paenibacillus sp. MBLB4367]